MSLPVTEVGRQKDMTPKEAEANYQAEWSTLNAKKEAAMVKGDVKAAKKYRRGLTATGS